MINISSSLILTSVPDHFPNKTLSPAFMSIGILFPDSSLAPAPTETISPSAGFSFAESGIINPPAVYSSLSKRRTTTRSCKGVNDIDDAPLSSQN